MDASQLSVLLRSKGGYTWEQAATCREIMNRTNYANGWFVLPWKGKKGKAWYLCLAALFLRIFFNKRTYGVLTRWFIKALFTPVIEWFQMNATVFPKCLHHYYLQERLKRLATTVRQNPYQMLCSDNEFKCSSKYHNLVLIGIIAVEGGPPCLVLGTASWGLRTMTLKLVKSKLAYNMGITRMKPSALHCKD